MTSVLSDAAKCVLCLAAVFVGADALPAHAQTATMNVGLLDDKFVPDHLIFRQGVSYRLHLENRGKHLHEFTAPKFFANVEVDNPDALNRERTEVVLEPGHAKDVFLTARKPGSYELRCADHDWEGMVGDITVE